MPNVIEQLLLPSDIKGLQSPRYLIYLTISIQSAGANKRRKLNNPLGNRLKPFFCIGRLRENVHFWNCQCKSAHYIL